MSNIRSVVRIAGAAAVGVGVVMLLYVALVVARARAPEPAVGPTSPATAALDVVIPRRPLVAGERLGQISIERLGLRAEIGEGEDASVLQSGAGHLADTAWLGEDGNVVLAGHRDTVFRALRKIQPGDVIEIITPYRSARYSVEATTIVTPVDLTVLQSFGGSTLTLITCYPFSFIGSAPNRFVVRARETR